MQISIYKHKLICYSFVRDMVGQLKCSNLKMHEWFRGVEGEVIRRNRGPLSMKTRTYEEVNL
jgi:hypothetical protein